MWVLHIEIKHEALIKFFSSNYKTQLKPNLYPFLFTKLAFGIILRYIKMSTDLPNLACCLLIKNTKERKKSHELYVIISAWY